MAIAFGILISVELEGLQNPGGLEGIRLRPGIFFANGGMNRIGQMFRPNYRPDPIHLQGPRLAGSTVSMSNRDRRKSQGPFQ
jgi:hypothetical protein